MIIATVPENMQVSKKQAERLEKQQYRMVGHHSAVKVCGWTKNLIRGKGGCYKYTFYGIRSHQCMQMTTSMFCASRCTFCWRGAKAPVTKDWYGPVDEPEHIINHAIDAHFGLLQGFKGNKDANQVRVKQMEQVRHVALSLTGEPITYPLIREIMDAFHARRISTFLVTNAQFPEQIKKIHKCTQLYLSIDAPNKELLKEIDKPLFPDYYERMLECLDLLATRTYRTCIRLTMIKGVNMCDPEGYAELIHRGDPQFIELKGYMWVGSSRDRLSGDNMPMMDDIRVYAETLLRHLPDYELASEHLPSRVVLLVRKDFVNKRWIDFPKFFDMLKEGKEFTAEDYSSEKIQPNT